MVSINNSKEILLRTAVNDDASFIRNISDDAFNDFGDYGDVVLKWFESKYSRTLIALHNKRRSGFAMLSYPFDRYNFVNSSEILAIAVSPENRGMGIGTALLKKIDELAYRIGTEIIFLHTATDNECAVRLFTGSGFGLWQIKRNFYPKGQDAFVMTKEINRAVQP